LINLSDSTSGKWMLVKVDEEPIANVQKK